MFVKLDTGSATAYPAGSAVSDAGLVVYPFHDTGSGNWYVHADPGADDSRWLRFAGGPYAAEADALTAIERIAHPLDPGDLA